MGYNWGTDVDLPEIVTDIRLVEAGDICPICGKPLKVTRGIEVGNIFQLGTKYSKPMNAVFLDQNGKTQPYVMGCYGIGVTRTLQSIVEQFHDEAGIKWPINVAPYHAVVVPINAKDDIQMGLANTLYESLKANGVEVVLDDRDERPGFKFKDWELIGLPFMVICGKRAAEGIVEFKDRKTLEKKELTIAEALNQILDAIEAEKKFNDAF
jgi:prolyl-tRNA synthetase